MVEVLKSFLKVLNVGSLILIIIWGILGGIHEIIGPVRFENILSVINSSMSFEAFCLIGYVLVIILIVTYVLKNFFK